MTERSERGLRFMVDAMLGNLVSWLRILGYDSLYWNGDDQSLLRKAAEEKRIILTKDRELYTCARKLGLEAILVVDEEVEAILSEMSRRLGLCLEFDPETTRCPVCNSVLMMEPGGGGPRWTCPQCGKHYWIGSHFRNISKTLMEARARARTL